MKSGGVGQEHFTRTLNRSFRVNQLHLFYVGPQLFKHAGSLLDERHHHRLGLCLEMSTEQSYTPALNPVVETGQIITDRLIDGGQIVRIIAGQNLQYPCDVFRPSSQRTNRVKGPTDRDHAPIADATHGRPKTADPIQRRRNTHRPACVRADCDQCHIRSNGRARAPAGTAGNACGVPGIVARAIMWIARRAANGPFVHIELAQNNGARPVQA